MIVKYMKVFMSKIRYIVVFYIKEWEKDIKNI